MSGTAELDALVIRNIAEIEAAMKHAIEEIGPRIWSNVAEAMTETCDIDGWIAVPDGEDEDVWFAEREWLLPDQRKPKADFWLGLDERVAGGNEGENSWLATFVASGPNGATTAFWIDQRIVGKGAWKKLIKANDVIVASLRDCGFSLDEDDDRRLCLPFVLDRELLATAFESGDFDEVMRPAASAVAMGMSAAPHLRRLRELALAVSAKAAG